MSPNLIAQSRLSQEELKRMLDYDPETGIFTWKTKTARCVQVGHAAGCVNSSGYANITVRGHLFLSHRLAWLYVYGEWPKDRIDHIDGNKTNNRIANLRDVTQSENTHNRRPDRGYSFDKEHGKWRAYIRLNGVLRTLGRFASEDDARKAYLEAKRIYHPTSPINNLPYDQARSLCNGT